MTPPGRGDRAAYARYLAGMDASMRQKVALTAAHLLCEGRVADMGMGSGAGSVALASLYPALHVIGVDLDPEMVDIARETHRVPNLSFEVGDIAKRVFEPESLDGIFDSSVLHHVTSFGGYRYDAAGDALAEQVRALRPFGVLVVRDFLAPLQRECFLDLPADDGDESDDPRSNSSAALFELFARQMRPLSDSPGFAFQRVEGHALDEGGALAAGRRRYRCTLRQATEFILRKDYRADWEAEVKEEYAYYTQREFEQVFARLGLRTLASTPIRNPWIIQHRVEGKVRVASLQGETLPSPATNYVIVGERVPAGHGVRFVDAGEAPSLGFLEASRWRNLQTGALRDLVRRPNRTLDVVPFFVDEHGDAFILARTSYPRPIVGAQGCPHVSPSLDETSPSTWLAEPLVVLQGDKPLGQTIEEDLRTSARIDPGDISRFLPGVTYYPSPGGTQEEVQSALVEVSPRFVEESLPPTTPFHACGRVRAIEARQLLRAAQVGGLPDARLEINAYHLLETLGRERGPWIGAEVQVEECSALPDTAAFPSIEAMRERPARRAYRREDDAAEPRFLEIRSRRFEEVDAWGDAVSDATLELVAPSKLSTNTVACAVLLRRQGRVFLGVDDDDLPAAQCFKGTSEILVAPAWRMPRDIATLPQAITWVRDKLHTEHGVQSQRVVELGGRYHPSAGLSPEVVHPLAVEVRALSDAPRPLTWLSLDALASAADLVFTAHLYVAIHRARHALDPKLAP